MYLFVLGNFWILKRKPVYRSTDYHNCHAMLFPRSVLQPLHAHRRLTASFISLCSQCQHLITIVDLLCLYGFDHYYDALLNCHYSRPNVKTGFCGMYRRNAIEKILSTVCGALNCQNTAQKLSCCSIMVKL